MGFLFTFANQSSARDELQRFNILQQVAQQAFQILCLGEKDEIDEKKDDISLALVQEFEDTIYLYQILRLDLSKNFSKEISRFEKKFLKNLTKSTADKRAVEILKTSMKSSKDKRPEVMFNRYGKLDFHSNSDLV